MSLRLDPTVVVIGASLGGTDAIRRVLQTLPSGFPLPIAMVLHRRADSNAALARSLGRESALRVEDVEAHTDLRPGHVYLAPGGYHLLVGCGELQLSVDGPELYARPSIDELFGSAAHSHGAGVISVLLTCSSEDGALGTRRVVDHGGCALVQDPEDAESAVASRAAIALGPVDYVVPVDAIGLILRDLANADDV